MSSQWYYSQGGQRQGPIAFDKLKELAASGQLGPTDLVWKEGMSQWAEAKSLKELFPIAPATSGQLPPTLPAAAPVIPPIPATTATPADAISNVQDSQGLQVPFNGGEWKQWNFTGIARRIGPLRFAWNEWDKGGRTIFVSSCIGVLSMFLTWVNLGFLHVNGFQQGAIVNLLVSFAYPVLRLFQGRPIHRYVGIGLGVWGVGCAVWCIEDYHTLGPGIFLWACVILIVGIILYRRSPAVSKL